jgi:hypothetical protein
VPVKETRPRMYAGCLRDVNGGSPARRRSVRSAPIDVAHPAPLGCT